MEDGCSPAGSTRPPALTAEMVNIHPTGTSTLTVTVRDSVFAVAGRGELCPIAAKVKLGSKISSGSAPPDTPCIGAPSFDIGLSLISVAPLDVSARTAGSHDGLLVAGLVSWKRITSPLIQQRGAPAATVSRRIPSACVQLPASAAITPFVSASIGICPSGVELPVRPSSSMMVPDGSSKFVRR